METWNAEHRLFLTASSLSSDLVRLFSSPSVASLPRHCCMESDSLGSRENIFSLPVS
jgi:hypothetical protein